jgi:hypothetical protein
MPLAIPARRADAHPPLRIQRDPRSAAGVVHKFAEPGDPLERSAQDSAAGLFPFVISSQALDLYGDVVVQAGRQDVAERIPAQVDHSGQMADLVGSWVNIRTVKAGADGRPARTLADLELHPKGITPAADMVRALLDAGVQLAASIGFKSIKREFLREGDSPDGAITGIRFLQWLLLEASVVVVPANPDALSVARDLLPSDEARAELDEFVRRSAQALHPIANATAAAGARTVRGVAMTIAERIAEARRALVAARDQLNAARERYAEEADDELAGDIETLAADVAAHERTLRLLGEAQADAAGTARAAAGGAAASTALALRERAQRPGADVIDVSARQVMGAPALLRRRSASVRPAELLIRAALCGLQAHVWHQPVDEVLEQRYGGDADTRTVALIVNKAAQNPALTTVPGWAQELVRETYGDFLDLLAVESVTAAMPFQRFMFDGFGKIIIPTRKPATTPTLAGAFRAEGAPIRVGAVSLAPAYLTPKSMGVIGSYTLEMLERSTPSIEAIIRDAMLQDTAIALDGAFLGATAGTAVQPPGVQNGVTAPNTRPSTGSSYAQINADLTGMAMQMLNSRLGRRPVWVMSAANKLWLESLLTPLGTIAYPSLAANGTLLGFPVFSSITVDSTIVYLIDAGSTAFAGGAPVFAGTQEASFHEEDTTPLPLVDNSATPVVAHPVRSTFQTNSAALRAVWELDWNVLPGANSGAVQLLTGCAWHG